MPTTTGRVPRRSLSRHPERHRSGRAPWLRAGVLGANDGLLSTAALMIGVAAAHSSRTAILTAGLAAAAAGAFSMAVGEYSSVSSQRDTELADLAVEQRELETEPDAEQAELVSIYRRRGLSPALARQVAAELSARDDVLAVHARDELGLDPDALARPVQAALVSAVSFTTGALVPILTIAAMPASWRIATAIVVTLVCLALLGALGARLGGAPIGKAALRVVVGGALALALTALIGRLVGAVV
jgi:vacuolar iron transporter family protein